MTAGARPRVVIVGGGFAGLYAARTLRRAPVDVLLVDRRNHHLFQPLLYQVATAGLAAPDIARPIRGILRNQRNVTVLLDELQAVDAERRVVVLGGGEERYDQLILAAGTTSSYFGHDDWARHAPSLKTLGDAFEIRRRTLLAFEAAEREADPKRRVPWQTFVVVGAGPTGVELAGALREIATRTLARDFRQIDPARTRVVLVEGAGRVLPGFPEVLSRKALGMLQTLGVEVRTGVHVTEVDAAGALLGDERVEARTILWAAGVRAPALTRTLGCELAPDGRVLVEPDLSVPGSPDVFVAGDLAALRQDGEWIPGMAPAAIQEGRHAAANALRRLRGETPRAFRYRDRGMLATVGRAAAVARVGRWHLGGLTAWVLWLCVHVFWLIGFRNRLIVLFEWAWAYVTWQRSARVVTELERREAGRRTPYSVATETPSMADDGDMRTRTERRKVARKLLEEHRTLRAEWERIDSDLEHFDAANPPEGLVAHLEAMLEHLARHFQLEESEGYLAGVDDFTARTDREAHELVRQHRAFEKRLAAAIEVLQDHLAEDRTLPGDFAEGVREMWRELAQHESRENALFQRLVDRDLGTGD